MKNLVAFIGLMFITVNGFSQENTSTVDTTAVKQTEIKQVKTETDSTSVTFVTSKKALIEADFDKSIFLFRTKKSKKTQLC
ncbi:MAG TPA: hypothetical protein VKZ97_03375 [Flavobacteriaceae bacterium]|nr:hypothetical protein [Flavobacteriaceae bacterium]